MIFLLILIFLVLLLVARVITAYRYNRGISRSYYNEQMEQDFKYTTYSYAMHFYHYTNKKIGEMPKLKFEQFKKFYMLNPESWSLCDNSVYKNKDPELSFTFDYEDWLKYKKFHEHIKEEKEQEKLRKKQEELNKKNNEKTVELLKLVQQDIDAARITIQKDLKEAADLIDRITKGQKEE